MQQQSQDNVVTPRDVIITITQEDDSKDAFTDDPIGKALRDMKDLFNSKLSIQWSRSTRQTYDSIEQWASKSNLNYLAHIDSVPASPSSELYKILISVPSSHQFIFQNREQTSILGIQDKSKLATVNLKISATLFDLDMKCFVGRTCVPNGIKLQTKQANVYSLPKDSAFEFYMYAEPTARYSIVLDFYMEQEAKDYQAKQAQSVGWLFTPIHALPIQQAANMAAGAAA